MSAMATLVSLYYQQIRTQDYPQLQLDPWLRWFVVDSGI
jgi:hypothetical protein